MVLGSSWPRGLLEAGGGAGQIPEVLLLPSWGWMLLLSFPSEGIHQRPLLYRLRREPQLHFLLAMRQTSLLRLNPNTL